MADGPEIYEVGDLRLDVGQQRLARAGSEVPLPRLSFNLLLALVRAAPNVLSIDELMSIVWAGLVVNPETVIQRVKMLRDAIGDEPRAPRYIGGLRGRGYQVICPVFRFDGGDEAVRPAPTAVDSSQISQSGEPGSAPVIPDAKNRRFAALASVAIPACILLVLAAIALRGGESGMPEAPPAHATGDDAPSVAVMPFRDLTVDGSAGFIALGVPEMILNRLATVPGLVVIARDSSFNVDAKSAEIEVAHGLDARWLVTGSVQRAADSIRITTRLIDPESNRQLWSDSLDGDLSSLFSLQEKIAGKVAGILRENIAGLATLPPGRRATRSAEAYLLFLEGRSRLTRWTIVDAEAAAAAFERAIALDREFAEAHASLYDARMMAADRRRQDLDAARRDNRRLIERAITLDPDSGAAYFVRAIWAPRDDPRRDADFSHGASLDPSNGRGLTAYSEFLDQQGRRDESEAMLARALRVDPLSPRAQFHHVMRGFGEQDPPTQEALMLKVLERDPNFQPALQRYAKYRWILDGRLAEAASIIEHAVAVDPENPWSRYTASAIYLDLGDPTAAEAIASGSAQSAIAGRLLQSLQRGDSFGAGEAAEAGAVRAYNRFESWGEAESIRDSALASHDYGTAIDYLNRRYGLSDSAELNIGNFRAATYVAQLLRASGDQDGANRLLDRLLPAIDASLPKFGAVYSLRTKAMILVLRGDPNGALAMLEESFRASDYTQWWYTLEHDPLWQPLRQDPRFRALDASVRAHVASERAALERLRQSGAVPAYDAMQARTRPAVRS